MKIFDSTLGTLEHALDARLLRHNVLAGNLANANTPGFVPREVDFAAAMRASAAASEARSPASPVFLSSAGHGAGELSRDIPLGTPGDLPGAPGSPVITQSADGAGLDGNAVDVDRALTAVAENAIQYGAAARSAQKKLAILRYAASDGTA